MEKVKELNGKKFITNKSFSYILPLCGSSFNDFKFCCGCFVGSNLFPEIKDKIHLLFNTNYSLFNYQDEWLQEHNLFNDKYQIDDNWVMYVFDLPKGYEENYYNFLNGKYFEMDDEYKRHIIKFHSSNNTEGLKAVLYKSEKLFVKLEKELEVTIPRTQNIGSLPNLKLEVFDISMIKNEDKEWI